MEKQIKITGGSIALSSYPFLLPDHLIHNDINNHELKVYSQNGEDGILLYLFSIIGTKNRTFIEFGIGDGKECNTANLSINFGWSGLLMDGDKANIKAARDFYNLKLNKTATCVRVKQAFITRENINDIIIRNGFKGEIDLLSIDIDGNDYWVWEAIDAVAPRVVVVEYNAVFGPTKSCSVEYDSNFDRSKKHNSLLYFGASLAAFVKLAEKKGYELIGCDKSGVNTFFVKKDLMTGVLKKVEPQQAYYPLMDRKLGLISEENFYSIQHLNFTKI